MCKKRLNSENWGTLYGIWLKACNDEQPIMFYDSCLVNFNLDSREDLEDIISKNRHLFRPLTQRTVENYKAYYRQNLVNFPTNMINNNEDVVQAIERINHNSGFTSQFRRQPGDPKSPKDIIDIGVSIIGKKWELEVATLEANDRRWSSFIIPILALIVAILAIIVD